MAADDAEGEGDGAEEASASFTMPEPDEEAPEAGESSPELSAEQLKQHLENLRPEDFGKFTL